MLNSEFLNISFPALYELGTENFAIYKNADPFPHIVLDNFFNEEALHKVVSEFPNLIDKQDIQFNNPNENKLASRGEHRFGNISTRLIHFLNSQPFLIFLNNLTGIQHLIPDPYYWGGGFHQIKRGGFLKIHADFNKHPEMGLDRRLNVLVYLNEDWEENYGGHFELWDKEMKTCKKKILPILNRLVIFSTTDYSFHGHPDPLNCPENRSRKSIALYYYTNGRPSGETTGIDRMSTNFQFRNGKDNNKMKNYNRVVSFASELMPPILLRYYKKVKAK